jgi:hypothetical protein
MFAVSTGKIGIIGIPGSNFAEIVIVTKSLDARERVKKRLDQAIADGVVPVARAHVPDERGARWPRCDLIHQNNAVQSIENVEWCATFSSQASLQPAPDIELPAIPVGIPCRYLARR